MTEAKYLDAGCGIGRFIYNQSKRLGGKFYGVDLDPKNIEQAQKSYPNIEFQTGSVEQLNFSDQNFDIVWSRDVLEHVDDVQKTLAEMTRVLKPGGKLIIKIPAKRSEQWLLKLRPSYWSEIHHVRMFEDKDIEKMVIPLGYELKLKEPQAFFDHFFLYFLFKTSDISETQLALGSWKNHWWGWFVAPIHAFLKPELVFDTWLKFVPVWIVTLPLGFVINAIGNRFMPKSWYYEFEKQR
jgi:SAM-dependent methyltransferase